MSVKLPINRNFTYSLPQERMDRLRDKILKQERAERFEKDKREKLDRIIRQQSIQLDIQQKNLQKLEQQKLEQKKLEQQRIEKERIDQQRIEQQRLKKDRIEQQSIEKERIENERIEQERLEHQSIEKERIKNERIEQERLENQRIENEKLEQQKIENERLEHQRIENEKLEIFNEEKLTEEISEEEKLAEEISEEERLMRQQKKIHPVAKDSDNNWITIIMTLYNKEKYVINSIRSVINQSSGNWELIIINDASTDNSYNLVNEYLSKNPDQRIKLHNLEKNYGTYVCSNLALLAATGKYICRLDADDSLVPRAVQQLLNTFEQNPQKDVIRFKSNRGSYGEIGLAYKKDIIKIIGYYDSVRFGADSEFKGRINKMIPVKKIITITDILYQINSTPNSLTTSQVSKLGGAHRTNYVYKFQQWHKNSKKCFIEFPQISRPFPVYDVMKTSYP